MHVYLKNGDRQRWLIVELVEGQVPKVTDLSCDDTKSITENLEPAIWFKVMVLETINVDCLNRMVSWTNSVRDRDGNPVANIIYGENRSCYDFDDDIDELFKIGNFLIDKSPLSEPNEGKRREQVMEYERSVIRILHCYILNKVIFQPCDIDCIGNALTTQRKSISLLEDTALVHARLAEHYLSQMRNIRELEILPVLEQLVDGLLVSETFIHVLRKDLKKMEDVLRREVDGAQKMVDILKEKLEECKSTQISHELECARRERNETFGNLELHLLAKELCRTWQPSRGGEEVEMNDNCSRYVKLHKRVVTEKSSSNLTIDKKLRAVSVRECIESVVEDLEKGLDSTGDDITVDGQRVTDVMTRENTAPEWQTLTQRLSAIVYNKDHPVGIAFHNFCENLQNNYRQIIRSLEHLASGCDTLAPTYEDFYIVSEKDYGLTRAFLEHQRNLISSHIYQITELLAEGFRNNWNMFVRKIRLCYEKCFYNRMGRDLSLMYRLVYTKSMRTLEERINKLKALEICKLGLEMKTEWWLELFESQSGAQSEVPLIIVNEVDGNDEYWDGGFLSEIDHENVDRVDLTDIGEEEYCETGHATGYFGRSLSADGMKTSLQTSKNKVLTRSCFSVSSAEMIPCKNMVEINSKLMEDDITGHANQATPPRFDSAAADRLLKDNTTSSNCSQLTRCNDDPPKQKKRVNSMRPGDSFDVHFGQALRIIRNVFLNPSPLKKMQCLTSALRVISNKVEELRMREHEETTVDRAEVAVTAEDLLPLVVLILLKLAAEDAAKLYVELLFVSDMMAEFLSSGCHSFALCEFQIAFRVLDQTCEELSI